MKKTLSCLLILLTLAGVLLSGCTVMYDKAPNEYTEIRWEAYDYSFYFTPSKDCKGKLTLDEKSYEVQVVVEGSHLKALDTGKNNAELFNAEWMYEDGDARLYVYNIMYNTTDYKELKNCRIEFIALKQGKIR